MILKSRFTSSSFCFIKVRKLFRFKLSWEVSPRPPLAIDEIKHKFYVIIIKVKY